MRPALVFAVVLFLAGCGGGNPTSNSGTSPKLGLEAAEQARACLEAHDLHVVGGPRPPGDRNAPDVELIVQNERAPTFIAFYRSVARANRYEREIRHNARRFNGSVDRHGAVTIVWTGAVGPETRAEIERCTA